ncbi:MAG TPA: hypothetical protein VF507_01375, partial [Pyrinomonadaceae bacterium]
DELQRRMEEARESISQTVAEIKDTVVNQYNSVKETVAETLDWREQFRKRPVAWSAGALGVGFVVGYSVGGVFKGDGDDEEAYARGGLTSAQTDVFRLPPSKLEGQPSPRSYAAQAITGGAYGSTAYAGEAAQQAGGATDDSGANLTYSGGKADEEEPRGRAGRARPLALAEEEEEEPQGPGLVERFKQTKAYDRLEEEVSHLGERFVEELSKTAQSVVLPALFNKVKGLFGVDLSGSRQSRGGASQGGSRAGGTAQTATQANAGVQQQSSAQAAGGGGAGGTSYGTSENRSYGATAQGRNT